MSWGDAGTFADDVFQNKMENVVVTLNLEVLIMQQK